MSFILSGAIKGAVAAVAGIAIVSPAAYSISRGGVIEEKYKLENISDFDDCLVAIEGNSLSSEDDNVYSNRRVLACQSSLNTKTHTNFYLWSEAKGDSQEMPKEINHAVIRNEGHLMQLVLTFVSESKANSTETINLSLRNWDFLRQGMNLKDECSVNFDSKLATCGKVNSQHLKHFLRELPKSR